MTKLAQPKLIGPVMGVWFLAAALGNKLAGESKSEPTHIATFFLTQAGYVGGATLLLFVLVPLLKKLMGAAYGRTAAGRECAHAGHLAPRLGERNPAHIQPPLRPAPASTQEPMIPEVFKAFVIQ
ncbi:MAG: hypothetical protein PHQ04_05485 [Opitutaceae bacterium]|nr:hypothetical protein [Opitutaceae bacterium]